MADILVFIRTTTVTAESGHWMDESGVLEKLNLQIDSNPALSVQQKVRKKEQLSMKFSKRRRPGDVLETQPDGFFCEPDERTGHGWDHHCFALVHCPGLSAKDAKKYTNLSPLGLKAGETRYMTPKELEDG